MTKNRLIAVIIIRDGSVVQSEQFRHNHVIHYDAIHAVKSFSRWDIDEIVMLNVSRENNNGDQFLDIIENVSRVCFVPLAVGGYIENEDYAAELIECGADKIVMNTVFKTNPSVPSALSNRFGKQCVVASIDVKDLNGNKFVHIDRGRVNTNETLDNWISHCEKYGAGEFFLNNIDRDGMRNGYDLDSLDIAVSVTQRPIIIFGGAAAENHFAMGLDHGASAVAAANMFHYKEMATKRVKRWLLRSAYNVREQS